MEKVNSFFKNNYVFILVQYFQDLILYRVKASALTNKSATHLTRETRRATIASAPPNKKRIKK